MALDKANTMVDKKSKNKLEADVSPGQFNDRE
jgi:hypothetical protein